MFTKLYIRAVVALVALAAVMTASATAQAASTSQRHKAVRYVRAHLGAPYQWGAVGPYRFDCSGLMVAAYRSAGVRLPRTTGAMLASLPRRKHRRPGDLVFPHAGHVAMYIGHGQVIAAPRTGLRVRIESVSRYTYARRSPW